MAELKKPRRIAFVLLWIATIALVVIWDRSPLAFVVAGFGLIALLFAFSERGWWPWLAALASAGFVVNWGLALVMVESTPRVLEIYVTVIRGALGFEAPFDSVVVLGYELVLPLLHAAAVLLLCAGALRTRAGH